MILLVLGSLYALKIIEDLKVLLLGELWLMIFTMLAIKTEYILEQKKTQTHSVNHQSDYFIKYHADSGKLCLIFKR